MGRWTPKDNRPVGQNEHIGRHLFDEPKLFGASDQNPLEGLQLRNFEPTSDNEFSVDRVGEGCFNPKVMAYLVPRAEAAAGRGHQKRTFHGWLTLPARKLNTPTLGVQWNLVPSPDQGQEIDGNKQPWTDSNVLQNLYHAHISVPSADSEPTKSERMFFAFLAREAFIKGEKHLCPVASSNTDSKGQTQEPQQDATGLIKTLARYWNRITRRKGNSHCEP
jgi:hypothetical protein